MSDRNVNNRRKAEKAAALLALHADNMAQQDRCLFPEEMAALVDGSCKKDASAKFMQHLSCCEKCYEEWLSLKKMASVSKAPKRVYRLGKMRKYGYIGSALAAAASVVVFLNITHQPISLQDDTFKETLRMQTDGKPAVPPIQQETEDLGAEKEVDRVVPMASVTELPQPEEPAEKGKATADGGNEFGQTMNGFSAPAPKAAARAAKKITSAEMAEAGKTLITVDSWLEQLKTNCRSDRKDADIWSTMRLQGRLVLKNQQGSLPKNKEEQVLTVLALLDEMTSETVTDQCRRLLSVLAEGGESR